MRIKKYAAAFLAATTVLGSLAACGKDKPADGDPTKTPDAPTSKPTDSPSGPTATPTPAATPIPARDLKGLSITIGDHWSPETPAAPANQHEQDTLAYREEIMKKYNFTIASKAVAGWGDMTAACVDSITAGDPLAQIFELDYRFVAKPMSNGLFYDLATLKEFDFSEDKWSDTVYDLMTKGGKTYGMRALKPEPRAGVIFNKRLFEEAGLDPDLLYDLQKSGEWTWSKFEELCKTLTRDTNGDGVTDVYATVSQGAVTLEALAMSNGAQFIGLNEDGTVFNNSGSKEVMDAMNFAVSLYNKGYEMPQPADSQWDWFYGAFQEGKAAMTFNDEYTCQPGQPYGDAMEDIVGFVMPPKPDGADRYRSYVCDNIAIIPACYDAQKAADIAFGYNVYTMDTPGWEGSDDWLNAYYPHFNDDRAVEETIVMFNNPEQIEFLNRTLVAGFEVGDLVWQYPFTAMTPADRVAEIKDSWDSLCAESNNYR